MEEGNIDRGLAERIPQSQEIDKGLIEMNLQPQEIDRGLMEMNPQPEDMKIKGGFVEMTSQPQDMKIKGEIMKMNSQPQEEKKKKQKMKYEGCLIINEASTQSGGKLKLLFAGVGGTGLVLLPDDIKQSIFQEVKRKFQNIKGMMFKEVNAIELDTENDLMISEKSLKTAYWKEDRDVMDGTEPRAVRSALQRTRMLLESQLEKQTKLRDNRSISMQKLDRVRGKLAEDWKAFEKAHLRMEEMLKISPEETREFNEQFVNLKGRVNNLEDEMEEFVEHVNK